MNNLESIAYYLKKVYKAINTVHNFTKPLGKSRYIVKRQFERVNVNNITLIHISVHTCIKARIFIVILSEFERSSLFITNFV